MMDKNMNNIDDKMMVIFCATFLGVVCILVASFQHSEKAFELAINFNTNIVSGLFGVAVGRALGK